MKKVIVQLRNFIISDFDLWTYLWAILFIATAIAVNYVFKFENKILVNHSDKSIVILRFFLYYGIAYFAIAIPKLWRKERLHLLRQSEFWVKIILFLMLISITSGFRFNIKWFTFVEDPMNRFYVLKLSTQIKCLLLYTVPFIIMHRVYDRSQRGVYGLNTNFGNGKVYLQMLLVIAPLIIAASFTQDFMQAYPRYKVWQFEGMQLMPSWLSTSVFESLYVLDFAMTEWMFRGALVIGMVTILGKDAILPMVSVYVFLHFGKPMGETISAFFGGYILGVLAYTTRHIWGGVLLHAGIALIMESMGLFQYYVMGMHR